MTTATFAKLATVVSFRPDAMAAVAQEVARVEGPGRRVTSIDVQDVPTASSWVLWRLAVSFDDGHSLDLVVKDLGRWLTVGDGAGSKPSVVLDSRREPWVYRRLSDSKVPGIPRRFDMRGDPRVPSSWLVLERVEGLHLWEVDFDPSWERAAEWLAAFHASVRPPSEAGAPLLRHSPELHRQWYRRALAIDDRTREIARLEAAHERAISIVLALPIRVLHGEFYPSNVLVEARTGRIRPIDWEMAGLGPAMLDLAALTTGLVEGQPETLIRRYLECAGATGTPLPKRLEPTRTLAAARLLLAIQWLGWSRNWAPPEAHGFDWLGEATLCARELRA